MFTSLVQRGAALLLAVATVAFNVGAVLILVLALDAAAQTATEVTIPVASWAESIGSFVGPVLAAAVIWLIRKLPSQIAAVLMAARVDQLLVKAIDYAIAATVGAAKDKPLTVNVGSEVVAKAFNYAIAHGPGWLISFAGGEVMLREKIIARLNVAENAALK